MEATAGGRDDAPTIDVLVLPAFAADDFVLPTDETEAGAAGDAPTELDRWVAAYDFDGEVTVPGANAPVRYTDDGIGIAPTGMGKVEAATTLAALLASPAVDLSEAYFVTAGIAGTPPSVGTLGAVFVADAVVDWDLKHRWTEAADGDCDSSAAPPADLLKYRPRDYVLRLDDDLVETAVDAAKRVDLSDSAEARAYSRRYEETAARSSPFVGVGATVCGDEFWHGAGFSEQAQWLVDRYDAGVYATAEMEDYAAARALARFDLLDRYLSVRGVVNFDRSAPGRTARESLDDGAVALDIGLENAFRAASAIVERLAARKP